MPGVEPVSGGAVLTLLAVAGGLAVVAATRGLLARAMIRAAINGAWGVALFLAWNAAAGPAWAIAVNAATVGTVGALGLPGFLLVLAARWWVSHGS